MLEKVKKKHVGNGCSSCINLKTLAINRFDARMQAKLFIKTLSCSIHMFPSEFKVSLADRMWRFANELRSPQARSQNTTVPVRTSIRGYTRKSWHVFFLAFHFISTGRHHLPKVELTRAGPLLGAERAGPGGGVFEHPHRLTWLMGHIAARDKRHPKERQKSWRNCFGHFLGQVIGQVTRGHQRSNFVDFNIFLQIGT